MTQSRRDGWKIERNAILDNLQPSLRDSIMFLVSPGLASWAKFSRPCGTELWIAVRTCALQPLAFVVRNAA
jgi:hypothetical protein